MYWANFLHFYQPPNQQEDILEAIVNQSYRCLLAGFKENPEAKATFNVSGSLLELLQNKGYQDVIDDLKFLLEKGQIELTGTAMYHAFLPLLPESEIIRQVKFHSELNACLFGNLYQPKGFFSPELAYDFKTAEVAKNLGFSWMVAPEIAYGPSKPTADRLYKVKNLGDFFVFFRNKRVSVLILSGIVRSAESLFDELAAEASTCQYILTIMDGETFGHHRPGLEKFLFELFKSKKIEKVMVSELPYYIKSTEEVAPRASTWTNEEQDFWLDKERTIVSENPFLLWKDSSNPIHKLQWEFTNWVIDLVNRFEATRGVSAHKLANLIPLSGIRRRNPAPYGAGNGVGRSLVRDTSSASPNKEPRQLLDKALSSDQFWWASAKPWWSLEMIEQGAFQLKEVVNLLPGVSEEDKKRAEEYYRKILEHAFDWQRKGVIRKKHKEAFGTFKKKPLKERTPSDWYNLLILEFEDEMKKAAQKCEYEKAIKWRDAIIKLREGLDIYDVLHVVDDLRVVRTIPSLKSFWEHDVSEFSEFAKSAFIDFDEEKFKKEKLEKLRKLRERQKAIKKGKIKFEEEGKYKV